MDKFLQFFENQCPSMDMRAVVEVVPEPDYCSKAFTEARSTLTTSQRLVAFVASSMKVFCLIEAAVGSPIAPK
ncbi:non-specific phospholipase C3-like [Iris pallida]|uniref:Non-specific phospholipase C3-like n=1 Tax=Iris pallida TaxID=29817 RepID=A0AAX6HD65_IRIPA|nr:non-specific phospholipase C3-like [Iris pallida]